MIIYLFRHGETDWNTARRVQGRSDIPLNQNGIEQARTVAQKIAHITFDAAYSSPLKRAARTAQILLEAQGENRPPLQCDERLMEIDFGSEEGDDLDHVIADEKDPLHNFILAPHLYTPPDGGETIDEVWDRVRAFFEQVLIPLEESLKGREDEARIMIVGHGAMIRAVTCNLSHRSYEDFWSDKKMTNLALNMIELKDGRMTLLEEAKAMLAEDEVTDFLPKLPPRK